MKDLKNYIPSEPEFILPKTVSFPQVIFEGAKSMSDVRKHLAGAFITENITSAKAERMLDAYEKTTIRANYGELIEDEQPKLEMTLAEAKANCKEIIKNAEDKLQSCITQIKDYAFQVKSGRKECDLPADSTVRIPVCGHWLYYAWINNAFRLCRVDKIPAWEADNLFANTETNKAAFKEILGIDITEAVNGETPTQEGGSK